MKKMLAMTLALMMLVAVLPGCVVQKLDMPAVAQPAEESEMNAPALEEEERDAQIPPELEFVDDDEEDESYDEFEFDIPRTLQAAPEGTLVDGIKVDYIVSDTLFSGQIDEFAYYYDEYVGKMFSLIGYVLLNEDDNTSFAVVRDFQEEHSDDEEGFYEYEDLDVELLPEESETADDVNDEEDGHEHQIYQVGIDCYFEGTLPKEDAWVRVVGTLSEYDYIDPETEESFPALRLTVESVKEIPETEGGSRMVTE